MKTKAVIVAGALMIATAPEANAALTNHYDAETGQCVRGYGHDDVDALAVARAVEKQLGEPEYSAAQLRADYREEAQRLRDELEAGGGVLTVPREGMEVQDPWNWADGVAEAIDFYVVEHQHAYGLGSSNGAGLPALMANEGSGAGFSSGPGSSLPGAEAVIPAWAHKVTAMTNGWEAQAGQACVDGRDVRVETPDATRAVADIERGSTGGQWGAAGFV